MKKELETNIREAIKNRKVSTDMALEGMVKDLQKKISLSDVEFLTLREIVKKAHKK